MISIIVGNVGALGQASLKRMLAYSSIAQAGYILVGVVVVTNLGVQAVLFYLAVYLFANLGAFAVVKLRERETAFGDDIRGDAADSARAARWMAVAMTLSMLSLAGIPATAGFIGKFRLIESAADGGYTWLGIVIVIGSMISLAYYLPVVAAMWRDEACRRGARHGRGHRAGPALAGGAPGPRSASRSRRSRCSAAPRRSSSGSSRSRSSTSSRARHAGSGWGSRTAADSWAPDQR